MFLSSAPPSYLDNTVSQGQAVFEKLKILKIDQLCPLLKIAFLENIIFMIRKKLIAKTTFKLLN